MNLERTDRVLRTLTTDGAFRVVTAVTSETARAAVAAQETRGETARWLGELITGAVLLRETVSPDRRVQVLIKDTDGRTQLVADAHPTGWNRGIVGPGARELVDLGRFSVLEVLYTLPNDVLQQGVVTVPAGSDVSTALMTYMSESEQIVTTIAVRTIVDHETTVRASGGFLVQLMPGASSEALRDMTEALERFTALDAVLSEGGLTPEVLRDRLLGAIPARDMARTYLCFGCNCDRARILSGLSTLPDEDIEDMIAQGDELDIQCDACGKHYGVTIAELQTLLDLREGIAPAPSN